MGPLLQLTKWTKVCTPQVRSKYAISTAAIRATYCSPCCYIVSLLPVNTVVNTYHCYLSMLAMLSIRIVAMLSLLPVLYAYCCHLLILQHTADGYCRHVSML